MDSTAQFKPGSLIFFELKNWEKEMIKKIPEFSSICCLESDPITLENVSSYADVAEVISVFIGSHLNAELLSKLPNLKLIATRSTGYDHIDIEYCKTHNIIVTNVPNYGENTVAEHAMALILSLAKRIPESIDRVKGGLFSPDGLTGIDLKDRIIGVIGTGRIGMNMIRMANGFGMKVIAYDLYPKPELEQGGNFTYVDIDYLMQKSDIVTLHAPYNDTTHHLLNRKRLEMTRQGVIIVNTARGGLIETDALYDGLKTGHIGGAGLDVLEEETFIKEELELLHTDHNLKNIDMKVALENHIMRYFPNVIITPHNAFNSKEALIRIIQISIENIKCYYSGACKNEVQK